MTIGNLLKSIDIQDHTTRARYPDGSGGRDEYTLLVLLDGHGTLLNAQVKEVCINHGMLCIHAKGPKKGGQA